MLGSCKLYKDYPHMHIHNHTQLHTRKYTCTHMHLVAATEGLTGGWQLGRGRGQLEALRAAAEAAKSEQQHNHQPPQQQQQQQQQQPSQQQQQQHANEAHQASLPLKRTHSSLQESGTKRLCLLSRRGSSTSTPPASRIAPMLPAGPPLPHAPAPEMGGSDAAPKHQQQRQQAGSGLGSAGADLACFQGRNASPDQLLPPDQAPQQKAVIPSCREGAQHLAVPDSPHHSPLQWPKSTLAAELVLQALPKWPIWQEGSQVGAWDRIFGFVLHIQKEQMAFF